jgi:hypothetical protein
MADATTVSVLLRAKDEVSGTLERVEGRMGRMSAAFESHRKSIGMGMSAVGGLITGLAGMAVKSSLDQVQGIQALDQSLKNIGTSYEANKKQIEDLTAAQQAKTNFGDEEQRKALQQLVQTTGDYDLSMQAMIPLMDTAAGTGKSLEATTLAVARAISGEETALSRYGITLEKGAGATAVLTELTATFGGQAAANADPLTQLTNRIGDLAQVLGDALLPMINIVLPAVEGLIRGWIEFADANPILSKTILIVATAVGTALVPLGLLMLMLPTLAIGFGMVSASILPITAVVLAATAAIAAGILIWNKWEESSVKVKIALFLLAPPIFALIAVIKNWDTIWGVLRKTAELVVNTIVEHINNLGKTFAGVFKLISGVLDKLPAPLKNLIPGFKNLEGALANVTATLEDGIPTIDVYNERQETIERLGEGLADSAEHWADVEEKSAERKITAMGNVTGAMSDNVEERKELEKEYVNWKERSDELVLQREKTAQELSTTQLRDYLRERLLLNNEHLADGFNATVESFKKTNEATQAGLNEIEDKWSASGATVDDVIQAWSDKTLLATSVISQLLRQQGYDVTSLASVTQGALELAGFAYDDLIGKIDLTTAAALALSRVPPPQPVYAPIPVEIPVPPITPEQEKAKEEAVAAAAARASQVSTRVSNQLRIDLGNAKTPKEISAALEKNRAREDAEENLLDASMSDYARATKRRAESLAAAAHGGLSPGGLTLVGERGPEIVSLPSGSFVHPTGTGPSGGVTLIFNGDVYGVEDLTEVIVEAVRDHAISGGFAGVFGGS